MQEKVAAEPDRDRRRDAPAPAPARSSVARVCAVTATGAADLATRGDVESLLRRFYGRVLDDELLEGPFVEIKEHGLQSHLPVMCDFWETVLFRAGLYKGSIMDVHQRVHTRHGVRTEHFLRWLALWVATIDQMYQGPIAERAKTQATRIAWAMHRQLIGVDAAELDAVIARQVGTRSSRR